MKDKDKFTKARKVKVCPIKGRDNKKGFLIELTFDNGEIATITYQQLQEIITSHPERQKLLAIQEQLERIKELYKEEFRQFLGVIKGINEVKVKNKDN